MRNGLGGTLLPLLALLLFELAESVKLFVPFPLVFIKTCYEGLDIWDFVFSAVVTPRRVLYGDSRLDGISQQRGNQFQITCCC